MDLSLAIPAFIAGLLTFLAPCTLPLVPAYLGFISGVSQKELGQTKRLGRIKAKIFLNGLFFILGFSVIFVLIGTLVGFVGTTLAQFRPWLSRIGGILVILFGLFMLNVVKLPWLGREIRLKTPSFFTAGKPLNSFALGFSFGLGWTPCVGPVLGAILTLAAVQATAIQGGLLLGVFSLGLAIPFLLIAAIIESASNFIFKAGRFLRIVSIIGGLFLIFLGLLLLTNRFSLWIAFFYRLFDFINYDRLLEYL